MYAGTSAFSYTKLSKALLNVKNVQWNGSSNSGSLKGWNSVLVLIEPGLNIEFANWIFADIHF